MKPKVYIFRGAPASGKGTVVPEFAKLLPKPVTLIEQDTLRWGFHLIGRGIEEITSEEHKMAYENTVILYERYLKNGKYTIVLEGLFTWDNELSSEGSAKQLLSLAREYNFEAVSIFLKANKNELRERNKRRAYTVPDEEFEMLYNGVYGKVDSSEIVLDSTDKSPEETIKELADRIQ